MPTVNNGNDECHNSSKKAICSRFDESISTVIPSGEVGYKGIADEVRNDEKLKIATEKVRETDDHKEQNKRKAALLPSVSGCGTFKKRNSADLIESNDCVVLDFDYADNAGFTPAQMRKIILGIEPLHAFFTMVSPSGKGLKVTVKINFALYKTLGMNRADVIHALIYYIAYNYVLIADRACTDIARLMFLCHDETVTYDESEQYCSLELKPWFDKYKESCGKSGKLVLDSADKAIHFDETPQEAEEHLLLVDSRINCDIIGKDYFDFIRVCFSLTNAGKTGRKVFLHCCSFYGDQTIDPGDLFDKLAKCSNVKATLGTFYQMCKDAGIDISNPKRQDTPKGDESKKESKSIKEKIISANNIDSLSYFSDDIIKDLPPRLRKLVSFYNKPEEIMMMVVAYITAASACFKNVYVMYGNQSPRRIESNLYSMIIAAAGSGKGNAQNAKRIVRMIHDVLYGRSVRAQKDYDKKVKEALQEAGKKDSKQNDFGKRPQEVSFIMAPDTSNSSLKMQLLNNDGCGLLTATEMSAFGITASMDYGLQNNSFLNMAFSHEPIHWERRGDSKDKAKDNENFCIKNPCLSVLFTGTLDQVSGIISSNADGLASRFIKVLLPEQKEFINQWNHKENVAKDEDAAINEMADTLHSLWIKLECLPEKELHYTEEQGNYVTDFFKNNFGIYRGLYGKNFNAISMRMGVIHMRLCMILTMLRLNCVDDLDKEIFFDDIDVRNALKMVEVLFEHSAYAYRIACDKERPIINYDNLRPEYKLHTAMPDTFSTNDALDVGKSLNMSKRSVQRWLKEFSDNDSENGLLIRKTKHGMYEKVDKMKKKNNTNEENEMN